MHNNYSITVHQIASNAADKMDRNLKIDAGSR